MEQTRENLEIIDPRQFCNISARNIDPNKIDHLIKIICKQWSFDLSVPIDCICANRALVLSVILN